MRCSRVCSSFGSVGLLLVGLTGCLEVTWWDAQGSWSGAVTVPGQAELQRSGSVSDPTAGPVEEPISLCDLTEMDLGLPFSPIQRDQPAAITIATARPLCMDGRTTITGGAVLIWGIPGSDPNVLAAIRSDAWTVTGEINVTGFVCGSGTPDTCGREPDLDVGESANVERIDGTLTLTATSSSGQIIRIRNAVFHLTVTASRIERSIS
jgi:hypothetical protein